MSDLMHDLHEHINAEAAEYSPDEERPLWGYVRVMSTYAAVVVGLGGVVALRRPSLPERPAARDLALVAAATAKLSRLLTRDSVTSPLRAPFTRFEGAAGSAEVSEEVRGSGLRHSIGELLTCPFCVSQWVATGFTYGLLLAPRTTRQVAGAFAALEAADFLQFGRAIAEKASAA
jgi:hypothetical protein